MEVVDQIILQRVIDSLNSAVTVNYESIDDEERGYPYAAGYSRSAMKAAVEDLSRILQNYN